MTPEEDAKLQEISLSISEEVFNLIIKRFKNEVRDISKEYNLTSSYLYSSLILCLSKINSNLMIGFSSQLFTENELRRHIEISSQLIKEYTLEDVDYFINKKHEQNKRV